MLAKLYAVSSVGNTISREGQDAYVILQKLKYRQDTGVQGLPLLEEEAVLSLFRPGSTRGL